jgi:hypothetical protein
MKVDIKQETISRRNTCRTENSRFVNMWDLVNENLLKEFKVKKFGEN